MEVTQSYGFAGLADFLLLIRKMEGQLAVLRADIGLRLLSAHSRDSDSDRQTWRSRLPASGTRRGHQTTADEVSDGGLAALALAAEQSDLTAAV